MSTSDRTQSDSMDLKRACDQLSRAISKKTDNPLYLCVWGEGYANPNQPSIGIHTLDFFSEDRGYDETDRRNIRDLDFGQSINIVGLAEVQSIVRVS